MPQKKGKIGFDKIIIFLLLLNIISSILAISTQTSPATYIKEIIGYIIFLVVFLLHIFNIRRKKTADFKYFGFEWLLLIFFVYMFVRNFFALNSQAAYKEYALLIYPFLLFYLSAIYLKKERFNLFFNVILAAVSFSCLYGIFQAFGFDPIPWGRQYILQETQKTLRIISTFGNPNYLGVFLIFIIPLTAAYAFLKKNINYYALCALVLQVFALFFTYNRGAYVAFVFSIFLIFILIKRDLKVFMSLALVLIIFLSLFFLMPTVRHRMESLTKAHHWDVKIRLALWRGALNIFNENLLFGVGSGNFKNEFLKYKGYDWDMVFPVNTHIVDYTHSEFIEMLVESGLTGTGLIITVFILFLFFIFKTARNKDDMLLKAYFIGITALIIHGFFSTKLRYFSSFVLPASMGGMLLSSYLKEKKVKINDMSYILFISVIVCAFTFIAVMKHYTVNSLHLKANFYAANRLMPELKITLNRLLKLDPLHPLFNYQMGFVKADEKNYGEAFEYYKKSMETFYSFRNAHLDSAKVLLSQRKFKEGLKALKKAEKIEPRNYDIPILKSRVYAEMGFTEESKKVLNRMIKTGRNAQAARRTLAFIYEKEEDNEKALYYLYRSFTGEDINDAVIYERIINIYLKEEKINEALKVSRAAHNKFGSEKIRKLPVANAITNTANKIYETRDNGRLLYELSKMWLYFGLYDQAMSEIKKMEAVNSPYAQITKLLLRASAPKYRDLTSSPPESRKYAAMYNHFKSELNEKGVKFVRKILNNDIFNLNLKDYKISDKNELSFTIEYYADDFLKDNGNIDMRLIAGDKTRHLKTINYDTKTLLPGKKIKAEYKGVIPYYDTLVITPHPFSDKKQVKVSLEFPDIDYIKILTKLYESENYSDFIKFSFAFLKKYEISFPQSEKENIKKTYNFILANLNDLKNKNLLEISVNKADVKPYFLEGFFSQIYIFYFDNLIKILSKDEIRATAQKLYDISMGHMYYDFNKRYTLGILSDKIDNFNTYEYLNEILNIHKYYYYFEDWETITFIMARSVFNLLITMEKNRENYMPALNLVRKYYDRGGNIIKNLNFYKNHSDENVSRLILNLKSDPYRWYLGSFISGYLNILAHFYSEEYIEKYKLFDLAPHLKNRFLVKANFSIKNYDETVRLAENFLDSYEFNEIVFEYYLKSLQRINIEKLSDAINDYKEYINPVYKYYEKKYLNKHNDFNILEYKFLSENLFFANSKIYGYIEKNGKIFIYGYFLEELTDEKLIFVNEEGAYELKGQRIGKNLYVFKINKKTLKNIGKAYLIMNRSILIPLNQKENKLSILK